MTAIPEHSRASVWGGTMDSDSDDAVRDPEEPKVFRVAQLDVPGGSAMDRRRFVQATVAGVGAVAAGTVLSGCDPEPEPQPAPIEAEEPVAPVEEEEPSDQTTMGAIITCECEAVCSCVGQCTCDSVCTCEAVCSCVGDCTCDSVSSGGSHYWYPS